MSTDSHAQIDGHHGHDDHAQSHGHHGDAPHGSRRDYLIGFFLSVVLTAIPFALVMTNAFADTRITAGLCMAFALVQIVVHMVYFLHMNAKVEGGWSLLALLFTVALVVIMLAGSVWVMVHMNANMMPTPDPAAMRNMP